MILPAVGSLFYAMAGGLLFLLYCERSKQLFYYINGLFLWANLKMCHIYWLLIVKAALGCYN